LLNLTTRVSGETPAIWSQEIAELDQRNRRIFIADEVSDILLDERGNDTRSIRRRCDEHGCFVANTIVGFILYR
jgi:hypothetical protein